jgi:hypothetical protein
MNKIERMKAVFAAAPDSGWVHVKLPLTFGTIIAKNEIITVYDIRFYVLGMSARKDMVVMFDDIRFMNGEAVETILPYRSAAKDITLAIRALDADATFDEYSAIVAQYAALPDEYKGIVMGYDEFFADYTEKFADQIAADKGAADVVTAQIRALSANIALEDKEAVEAARAAYEALTDGQKALVEGLSVLRAAEAKIQELEAAADKAAADAVTQMIAALPADITVEDGEAIKAARAAYEALTDAQKALVGNLAVLKVAEEVYAELTAVDYGDVDGDGQITSIDALMALQAGLGKIALSDKDMQKANVDGNTVVNAVDALYILQKSLNKIDKFPAEVQ